MLDISSDLQQPSGWLTSPICRIEDLRDAVRGAGLDAVQMSRGMLDGSLAFLQIDDLQMTSGLINGKVGLTGPLSEDCITFGIGLRIPPGCRHWHHELGTGAFGLFLEGDEHASLYPPGSPYVALTLHEEQLIELAAQEERVVDRSTLGGTGFRPETLLDAVVAALAHQMDLVHHGVHGAGVDVPTAMLRLAISAYSRAPGIGSRAAAMRTETRLRPVADPQRPPGFRPKGGGINREPWDGLEAARTTFHLPGGTFPLD
ncbi:hypothetical protein RM190_22440 [Paracoccus sp. CPCC 101403]|uniref:AraC family transcriptional regulator n=1 Tax=Paracoccus broussonetiae TaxID=3075834 RepID=A0ABU3EK50_9RHOB|nr:hypothetical protein [Paracoccus sp. CPCC 101403]MDT1064633.1 hypothetical protein [Paracoccus sp. CPCC 101403]